MKDLTAPQIEMLEAARTFIERLRARAKQCDPLDLPILTRDWDYAAKILSEGVANQLRALRDGALAEDKQHAKPGN